MQVQTPIDVNALRDELLAIPNVLPAVEELRKVQRELEQVAQVDAGTANASVKSTEDPVPPCEAAPEPTQGEYDAFFSLLEGLGELQIRRISQGSGSAWCHRWLEHCSWQTRFQVQGLVRLAYFILFLRIFRFTCSWSVVSTCCLWFQSSYFEVRSTVLLPKNWEISLVV